MFAVQFDAVIKDRTIVIPAREASVLPKKVKVIILAEHEEKPVYKHAFDAIKLHTSGFVFSREEANGR